MRLMRLGVVTCLRAKEATNAEWIAVYLQGEHKSQRVSPSSCEASEGL